MKRKIYPIIFCSSILLAFSMTTAYAMQSPPYNATLRFSCPVTKFDPCGTTVHVLERSGNVISGPGKETMNDLPLALPIFTTTVTGNVPSDIESGNYYRSATSYDAGTGVVSCHYVSSAGFDPFTVSFLIPNGEGGYVYSSSSGYITIRYYIGFTHNSN